MTQTVEAPLSVQELEELRREARRLAVEAGLDPWEVTFGVVDHDTLNEVSAYDGFPTRYPHWHFGMAYDYFRKRGAYSGWWTYELVLNTRPAIAYLRASNSRVETKGVMVHVYAHVDFFHHNRWFSKTNRDMIKVMEQHAQHIERYMEKYGVERVESFIDRVLSIQYNIDPHAPFIKRRWGALSVSQRKKPRRPVIGDEAEGQEETEKIARIPAKRDYMDRYLNPREWIEEQRKRLESERERRRLRDASELDEPQKDLLQFLMRFGRLEEWQKDIIAMVREESYYFVPQIQTKVMNEGWACVVAGTPVFTDRGILPIEEIVEKRLPVRVSDGEGFRRVYDYARFPNREVVKIRTRRGFELAGSRTHQVLLEDGSWRRLDELQPGDRVRLVAGVGRWPLEYVRLEWEPTHRFTLEDAARQAGVSLSTVLRYREGRAIRKNSAQVAAAVAQYEAQSSGALACLPRNRRRIAIPRVLDEELAAFLGYLVGDGHLSRVKRVVGLTTGDDEQALKFQELGERLFGLPARVLRDGSRWRVLFHSLELLDFLESLGLTSGPSAAQKKVPPLILRSPKTVVASFLRAYFDCDAYAGEQGVILSTRSRDLAHMIQILLLNFGILSRRRPQKDGCWHVDLMGRPAQVFYEEIGFGLARKQEALRHYLAAHHFFKREEWVDEIVAIERTRADVYDLSVEGTHRYAAAGLVNHNSFWQSKLMAEFADSNEFLDHADMMSKVLGGGALNPYSLGKLLWEDIKERWDKGRFGREWELCKDAEKKKHWDTGANKGLEKIFEVRRTYNDLTFIDEFFTEELFEKLNLFAYEYIPETGAYHITSRNYEDVKKKLLLQYTNLGRPTIKVVTGNYDNKGELLLIHEWNGIRLHWEEAKQVLKNLYEMWGRPVNLKTITLRKARDPDPTRQRIHPERPLTAVFEEQGVLLRYDGEAFHEIVLDPEDVEDLRVDDVDYHTTPREWIG